MNYKKQSLTFLCLCTLTTMNWGMQSTLISMLAEEALDPASTTAASEKWHDEVLRLLTVNLHKDPTILNLRNAQLTNDQLRQVIGSLSESTCNAIKLLYLDNNQLTALPAEITRFKNLRLLDVANNPLTTMEAIVALVPLESVGVNLTLPTEPISKILFSIGTADNISYLGVMSAQLTTEQLRQMIDILPEDIRNVIAFLDLSDNQLTALPAEIALFKNLKHLQIMKNPLTTIEEIEPLEHLMDLVVDQTVTLPTGLRSDIQIFHDEDSLRAARIADMHTTQSPIAPAPGVPLTVDTESVFPREADIFTDGPSYRRKKPSMLAEILTIHEQDDTFDLPVLAKDAVVISSPNLPPLMSAATAQVPESIFYMTQNPTGVSAKAWRCALESLRNSGGTALAINGVELTTSELTIIIDALPHYFFQTLYTLNVNNNRLIELPAKIAEFPRLTFIYIDKSVILPLGLNDGIRIRRK